MKLVEIIKSKNGLSFLGANKKLIPVHSQRLDSELPSYNPEVKYEECEFSFKEFVRPLSKTYHKTFQNIITDLARLIGDTVKSQMRDVLCNRNIDFDGDFIAINTEGEVSFMPYNKVQKVKNGIYLKTGRQEISIHKFVAKVFKNDKRFTEKDIKDFAELLRSIACMELTVEFLKGEDVGKFYESVSNVGWARGSCMANKKEYPAKKFKIYDDNCELGVIKDGEEPVGRFLRWTSDKGKYYEDSVYYKTMSVKSWYDQRCTREKILHSMAVKQGELTFPLKKPLSHYPSEERPPYFDSLDFDQKEPFAKNRY